MTTMQMVIGLVALLGIREDKWDLHSGHTNRESFVVLRLEHIKKGQLRRIHRMVDSLVAEEMGE